MDHRFDSLKKRRLKSHCECEGQYAPNDRNLLVTDYGYLGFLAGAKKLAE